MTSSKIECSVMARDPIQRSKLTKDLEIVKRDAARRNPRHLIDVYFT